MQYCYCLFIINIYCVLIVLLQKCIQYCRDAGFPNAEQFSYKLNNSLGLSEHEKNKLVSLVGKEFLELPKETAVHN